MDQKEISIHNSNSNGKPKRKRRRSRRRKNRQKDLSHKLARADELLEDPRVLADPNVQAVLAKAQTAQSAREVLEAHLLIEKVIIGARSTLDDPERAIELSNARIDAEQRDRDEEAFLTDEQGFIDDVFARSEKHKKTGDEADKTKAMAMKMYAVAKEGQLASRRQKELELDSMIEHGPRVTVTATGQWIKIGSMPNVQNVLRPDYVRIMHRSYELTPGLNENVPEVFAKQYELVQRSRMETQERDQAMNIKRSGGTLEASAMERKLMDIDRKYGVKRQQLGAQ